MINERQNEIIEEFELLADDREQMLYYIMEIGEKLSPLDSVHKMDQNLVKGCQSKVWLICRKEGDQLYFEADSNTAITKGLISLLIRILSGATLEEIINCDLFFLGKIGLKHIIGSQRSNGLASMIKQMKLFAIAFQTQKQA